MVYEQKRIVQKDYKGHIMVNIINLSTFPKRAQAASLSTRATFKMVDVNAMVETLRDRLAQPFGKNITVRFTALELKKSSLCAICNTYTFMTLSVTIAA